MGITGNPLQYWNLMGIISGYTHGYIFNLLLYLYEYNRCMIRFNKKTIKSFTYEDWTPSLVLEIEYSFNKRRWIAQVKDYPADIDRAMEKKFLDSIRIWIREQHERMDSQALQTMETLANMRALQLNSK